MKQIVIALIGHPGAGKSTALAYLKERYRASGYRFSDYLGETLDLWGKLRTRDMYSRISQALETEFGQDFLAYRFLHATKNDTSPVLVIDGLRRLADHLRLAGAPLSYWPVAIKASPDHRFDRSCARGEKPEDQTMSRTEFDAMHELHAEQEVIQLAKYACRTIDNNGTLEDLRSQLDALMHSLGIKKHL